MGTKRIVGVSTAAALILMLSACGSSSEARSSSAPPTAQQTAPGGLVADGAFTVCVNAEFPPMESLKDGTSGDPVGFDISAAQAVGDVWGLNTVLINTAFDGLLPSLNSGKCDAVWSATYINDERKAVADAVPYLRTGNAVLVPTGNPKGIKSIDDLAGLRVAVAGGTDTLTTLTELNKTFAAAGKPQMELSVYPRFTEEVGAISSGKADAMVEVDVSVQYVAKQSPSQFEALNTVFKPEAELGVYVNKGSNLAAALSTAWAKVVSSGRAAEIAAEFGLAPGNLVPQS